MSVVTRGLINRLAEQHEPARLRYIKQRGCGRADSRPMRTMRGAAIPAPRLHKMPGMLFSAPPKELQGTDHSLLDDKTQKRRPKTL